MKYKKRDKISPIQQDPSYVETLNVIKCFLLFDFLKKYSSSLFICLAYGMV